MVGTMTLRRCLCLIFVFVLTIGSIENYNIQTGPVYDKVNHCGLCLVTTRQLVIENVQGDPYLRTKHGKYINNITEIICESKEEQKNSPCAKKHKQEEKKGGTKFYCNQITSQLEIPYYHFGDTKKHIKSGFRTNNIEYYSGCDCQKED